MSSDGYNPAVPSRIPAFAVLLGAAGLIPFVVLTFGAIGVNVVLGERMVRWLIAYGAVILAFLGGVHWGFVLQPVPGAPAVNPRARLGFGVTPSLIGFVALVVTPWIGLGVLIAGFIFTTISEAEANRRALLPPGYMLLRYALTAVVVILLAIVMFLRAVGAHFG